MVWEQRSSSIVMLTRLEERARIKCDQYWPTRGTECYGVMSVTLTDTQELATYCIRTFQLQRVSSMNVSIPWTLHINLHVVKFIYFPHLVHLSLLFSKVYMQMERIFLSHLTRPIIQRKARQLDINWKEIKIFIF